MNVSMSTIFASLSPATIRIVMACVSTMTEAKVIQFYYHYCMLLKIHLKEATNLSYAFFKFNVSDGKLVYFHTVPDSETECRRT